VCLALVWVQTASAWHEADHALHGHAIDDIACDILSGTAEQPAGLIVHVVVSPQKSSTHRTAVRKITASYAITRAYRSRAPPSVT